MLTVVRGLPLTADGQVALACRSKDSAYQPGLYEFPGGQIDPKDHSFDHALKREFLEELGCLCLWISRIPVYHTLRIIPDGKYRGKKHVTFAYPVIIDAAHIRLGTEHTALQFVPNLRELQNIPGCTPFTHAAAQAMLGMPRRLLTPHARKFI